MQNDLDLIAGSLEDFEIPKPKQYLLKYFTTDIQRAFLRFVLFTGDKTNFVSRTGQSCSTRMVRKMWERYEYLTQSYDAAKRDFTESGLEILQQIEMGKFRC